MKRIFDFVSRLPRWMGLVPLALSSLAATYAVRLVVEHTLDASQMSAFVSGVSIFSAIFFGLMSWLFFVAVAYFVGQRGAQKEHGGFADFAMLAGWVALFTALDQMLGIVGFESALEAAKPVLWKALASFALNATAYAWLGVTVRHYFDVTPRRALCAVALPLGVAIFELVVSLNAIGS